jgi:hypothetical protein
VNREHNMVFHLCPAKFLSLFVWVARYMPRRLLVVCSVTDPVNTAAPAGCLRGPIALLACVYVSYRSSLFL